MIVTDTAIPTPTLPIPTPSIPTSLPTLDPVVTPTPSTTSSTIAGEYLGLPLWTWAIAAVALIVLIILLVAISHSGRKRSQWDQSFRLRLADARWVADSLTLAVADRTKSVPEILRTWNDGAPRLTTLSQQLYGLSSLASSDKRMQAPRLVAAAIDNLQQALNADVRMRTQGSAPGQDALIAESASIVAQRRNELLATLQAVS
ncbi:MAG: hypothetical protein HQ526_01590 [Actinobacteria bacterium]|nr:hypothetical protein [Actinomycetota bacterium]